MALTSKEIKALNDWARTEPTLRGVFPYTENRPGLGDRLESLDGGSSNLTVTDDVKVFSAVEVLNLNPDQFYLTSAPDGSPIINSSMTSGGSGGVTDHGALTGLLDDDHPQYLLVNGTRAMTGDLNMGGKDILNAAAGLFKDKVVAEAFYLENGGQISASGSNLQLQAAGTTVIVNDNLTVTGSAVVSNDLTVNGALGVSGDTNVVGDVFASNVFASAVVQAAGSLRSPEVITDQLDNLTSLSIIALGGDLSLTSVAGSDINMTSGDDLNINVTDDVVVGASDISITATGSIEVQGPIHTTDTIKSDHQISAEAFYLKAGGNLYSSGASLVLEKTANGKITVGADSVDIRGFVHTTDSIESDNVVTAEAFYLKRGGELIVGIDVDDQIGQTYFDSPTLTFNPADFYLSASSRGTPIINLNQSPSVLFSKQYSIQRAGNVVNTSDTVFSPVPELTFPVTAGNTYHFRFVFNIIADASTTGFTVQLDTPATTTYTAVAQLVAAAGTAGTSTSTLQVGTPSGATANGISGQGAINTIEGFITPSASGSVTLTFHREPASGGTVTCANNSFVEWMRIV